MEAYQRGGGEGRMGERVQRMPNKMDAKRTTTRHIEIKMPKVKDKEKILKAAREKQSITYKGVPIRVSADFSKETLQARSEKYSK